MTRHLLCWNCGTNLDDTPRPISRHATCPECFNELHCCRLCRHYDPKRTMQCFEDRADPPLQKENANFCDFYSPRFGAYEGSTTTKSEGARKELDALFGGDDAADSDEDMQSHPDDNAGSDVGETRRKLDDLFD